MKKKLYMCGPITGLTYNESLEYRKHLEERLQDLGFETFCPMRGKAFLEQDMGNKKLPNSFAHTKNSHLPFVNEQSIFMRDRFDVLNSDMIIANFLPVETVEIENQIVSIGSVFEIAWAMDYNIPVIAIMTKNNIHQHLFIRRACMEIVPDLETAINVISVYFNI